MATPALESNGDRSVADDVSDGSDEWGAAELVIPAEVIQSNNMQPSEASAPLNDDDYWKVKPTVSSKSEIIKESAKLEDDRTGEPMIIVDMTLMDPHIHSRFDPNAVNDSQGASKLRKMIEQDYAKYAKQSPQLVANGTIIPCGSSVWRPALVKLRKDRPGHYFCPIFGPRKKY